MDQVLQQAATAGAAAAGPNGLAYAAIGVVLVVILALLRQR